MQVKAFDTFFVDSKLRLMIRTFIQTSFSVKRFLIIVTLPLFILGCEFKDIELQTVDDVKIESLNKGNIKGTITLTLNNPNGFAVTVKEADFKIMLEKTEMGTANLSESFKIKANSTESYPVKLKGDVSGAMTGGLAGIVGMLLGKDPKVTLVGEIRARSFLISKTIPVEFETELPISSFTN